MKYCHTIIICLVIDYIDNLTLLKYKEIGTAEIRICLSITFATTLIRTNSSLSSQSSHNHIYINI